MESAKAFLSWTGRYTFVFVLALFVLMSTTPIVSYHPIRVRGISSTMVFFIEEGKTTRSWYAEDLTEDPRENPTVSAASQAQDALTEFTPRNTDMESILNLAKSGSKYFVGISNGHQGTTFLTSSERYKSGVQRVENFGFFFEGVSNCVKYPCETSQFSICPLSSPRHPLREWYAHLPTSGKSTYVYEEQLVSKVCIPDWTARSKDKVVVLGHDTIYYFHGFKRYFEDTIFVRLRRSRIETARSFAISCKYGRTPDPMKQFMPVNSSNCFFQVPCRGAHRLASYGYCPLDQPESVVLKPPRKVWESLSYYQRALWYVDELEARWTQFIEANPQAKYIEVFWSSRHPELYGSMDEVHRSVATLLGLEQSVNRTVINNHAPARDNVGDLYRVQDLEYQEKMQFTPEMRRLIRKVQF